jgi:hypothetical protein
MSKLYRREEELELAIHHESPGLAAKQEKCLMIIRWQWRGRLYEFEKRT